MSSPITTHVLDTARGRPASGVAAVLEVLTETCEWQELGRGITNDDGRIRTLLPEHHRLEPGSYRLTFDTGAYFDALKVAAFYPYVSIVFVIQELGSHYHVPLLLSPYGFSTYRGS